MENGTCSKLRKMTSSNENGQDRPVLDLALELTLHLIRLFLTINKQCSSNATIGRRKEVVIFEYVSFKR